MLEDQLEKSLNKTYPAGAVAYMKAHGLHANLLNFYLWGGYLDWHSRDNKIFVDSRVDIFEYAGVFADYVDLRGLKNTDELFAKYGIRYVLIPATEPLSYLLEHDPSWKMDYRDASCVLFEKIA